MIDLEALEKSLNQAAPGPWSVDYEALTFINDEGDEEEVCQCEYPEDANYIADAHNALPELIAEMRRLREVEASIRAVGEEHGMKDWATTAILSRIAGMLGGNNGE